MRYEDHDDAVEQSREMIATMQYFIDYFKSLKKSINDEIRNHSNFVLKM
jgi:hypothetical protein